jgi:hypothetical protein
MGHEIRDLNRSISLDSAGNEFIKLAKCLAATSREPIGSSTIRQMASRISPRVAEIVENYKAAVGVAGLSEAIAPYQALAAGFVASMAEFSAASRILNAGDWYRVPLRTRVAVLTSAPVGYTVSQFAAKPMTAASFVQDLFDPIKVNSMVAVSNDLARSISQASLAQMSAELRRAASIAVDAKMLAVLAATSGITSAASTGITAAAILSDLTGRLTALTIGADSRLWWIVSPKLYKTLSLVQGAGGYIMTNNKIGQINVAPSDAATTTAFLIDAKQVAFELDNVVLDRSTHASVEMADNPTASDYQLVSLWANNMTGLRCEIWFGCLALRSTGVTMLTGYS